MMIDPQAMESVGMVCREFHPLKGISAFIELALPAEFGQHAASRLSRIVRLDFATG